jgi:hypothetical protein
MATHNKSIPQIPIAARNRAITLNPNQTMSLNTSRKIVWVLPYLQENFASSFGKGGVSWRRQGIKKCFCAGTSMVSPGSGRVPERKLSTVGAIWFMQVTTAMCPHPS